MDYARIGIGYLLYAFIVSLASIAQGSHPVIRAIDILFGLTVLLPVAFGMVAVSLYLIVTGIRG